MRQVLQGLKDGKTEVANVPVPSPTSRQLLIQTSRSLISVGTERMLVEFGKAGWLNKARQQPDKVGMVLDKIKTDGLLPTIEAVQNKLDQPLPLGYCNVGRVTGAGRNIAGFEVGERVVTNGAHAEFVVVSPTLAAKIPDNVSDDEAAFTVLASIALQGIRLAQPTLGETVVVSGLGLIGLLAVQMLRANGCRVIGLDFDNSKLELARQFGAETIDLSSGQDPVAAAMGLTAGRGVDAILICASTKSSEPVSQAARMARKRGRIVLVGVTGLELSRADFYEKELSFQVSCSYGPGRYDPQYEERANDYPIAYVRWTEQRNFEAVLDLLSDRKIDVAPLISHRYQIEDAADAYDLISGGQSALGVILEYPQSSPEPAARTVSIKPPAETAALPATGAPCVGFIGSGNYASAVLAPAFAATGARLHSIGSARGLSAFQVARSTGFEECTTDVEALLADATIDAVVISTRHDSHAEMVIAGLRAEKHVFVEKPLCLSMDELAEIKQVHREFAERGKPRLLMVGFNRRFAPQVISIKQALEDVAGPKALTMTVNAGAIPADHWTQDPTVGGGRIIGEACHFVDLIRHLVGAPISHAEIACMDDATRDTAAISLRFADGSIGTINYFANGSKSFPKERLEVFAGGGIIQLDNFRVLKAFGWPSVKGGRMWRQNKGQRACAEAFVQAARDGGESPIPAAQIFEVAERTISLTGTG